MKLQTKNIQRSRTRLSSRLKGKLFVNGDFETGLDRDITSIANQIIDLKRERTDGSCIEFYGVRGNRWMIKTRNT